MQNCSKSIDQSNAKRMVDVVAARSGCLGHRNNRNLGVANKPDYRLVPKHHLAHRLVYQNLPNLSMKCYLVDLSTYIRTNFHDTNENIFEQIKIKK